MQARLHAVWLLCQALYTDYGGVQDERSKRSGAPRQHRPLIAESGEVLAPAELQRAAWGADFQRVIGAAYRLVGIRTDKELADLLGISETALQGWWSGAQPRVERLYALAEVVGMNPDELVRWVYRGGPQPSMPSPEEQERVMREARRWADSSLPPHMRRPSDRE